MRASHSSSCAGGRAFNARNEPTTPALHWAMTRSGTEMMNSGAPITGSDRRPLNKAGIDMLQKFLFPDSGKRFPLKNAFGSKMPDIIPPKQRAKSRLLAERGRDVVVGAAVLGLALPSRDQHFGRTGLRGIGVETFALLVALALAELVGTRLAVRRAGGRDRTDHAPGYHRARLG